MNDRALVFGNSLARRFYSPRQPVNSLAADGAKRSVRERVMGSHGVARGAYLAGASASLLGICLAAIAYTSAIPVILGVAALTAGVVGPIAIRAGFRYGAKRGIEAAIEAMAQEDY